ncbi:hypothetical protein FRC02_008144 [Tulasnella sp. 418]|nr:hypothetical protein FRC02_008144 [Tulasnella sp. 418]
MLISDPDYLTHALRLTYLRNLDDPFGSRVITLNPRYPSNPYIRASGLADYEKWPEIHRPTSPQPTPDPNYRPHHPNGSSSLPISTDGNSKYSSQVADPPGIWPGATGLKYTQTIVGPGRVPMAGMRVSGRRGSGIRSKPDSITSSDARLQRVRADSAPTPVSSSPSPTSGVAVKVTPDSPETFGDTSLIQIGKRRSSGGSTVVVPSVNTEDTILSANPPTAQSDTHSHIASERADSQEDSGLPPLPAFALRFARGAEMEARRRERMRLRFSGATAPSAPREGGNGHQHTIIDGTANGGSEPLPTALDSSDDETERHATAAAETHTESREVDVLSEDDDEDEGVLLAGELDGEADEVHEDDEFDGDEFLNTQFGSQPLLPSRTISDDNSLISSPSGLSISQSSGFGSSLHIVQGARNRSKLSPVSEVHPNGSPTSKLPPVVEASDAAEITESIVPIPAHLNRSYFSISPPAPVNKHHPSAITSSTASSVPTRVDTMPIYSPPLGSTRISGSDGASLSQGTSSSRPSDPIFAKREIIQRPNRSALSAMLASQASVSDNPFAELYGAIAGRADSASITLRVYFPHSKTASITPLTLKTRRDASVEEVIGFALWAYWDMGIEPKLDAGLGGDDDPKRAIRLSAVGWNLRIAEDDGEIDEDFPALDRTRPISKFSFDNFGVCEASATQVEQNRILEAKIVRRPSRLMIAKKPRPPEPTTGAGGLVPPQGAAPAVSSSSLTSSDVLTSSALTGITTQTGGIAAPGPPVFLRVRVATTADTHYSTTINATSEEYMADILARVCRRRRLDNPKEWALLTGDMRIVIPLDRTVASLAGNKDLVLVKKSLLEQLGLTQDKRLARSSDPNGKEVSCP